MSVPLPSGINFVYDPAASGAPTTGTWALNDVVMDKDGLIWRCSVAGSPGTWAQYGGASSLAYFTEARNTASPNATIPVHSLAASGAEASIDFALIPKGVGGFALAVADGTTVGGNKRGNYAVDLQLVRAVNTYVASGNYSFIGGGSNNRASGGWSGCVAGSGNAVTQTYSVALGGGSNSVTAQNAAALVAQGGVIATQYAVGIGSNPKPTTDRNVTIGNGYGNAIGTTIAGSQSEQFMADAITTSTTAVALTGGTSFTVPMDDNDSMVMGVAQVAAYQRGATANAQGYVVEFTAKRGTGAASVAIVGTTVVRAQENNTSYNVTVTADTTVGGININGVGIASTTTDWAALVKIVRLHRGT